MTQGPAGVEEQHRRHLFEGEPEEDLVEALEPDQLVAAMETRVSRRDVGGWVRVALWALRVLLLLLTAMVAYAFAVSLTR